MDTARDLILSTPVFPYLWVPHCILMCTALRSSTLGSDRWRQFSRTHPLSCLMLALVYIFPGGILANLVHGDPLLAFMRLGWNLYSSLLVWYLVFYSPADLFFKMVSGFPGLLSLFTILQDWQRIGLVLSGLETINEEAPGLFLYPVVFGVIKSSGFMFVKYLEVGILQGLKTGFRVPNQATKTMIFAAILLQLHKLYDLFPVSMQELYCIMVVFAISMRLVTILLTRSDWDPYLSFEYVISYLLFGNPEEQNSTNSTNQEKNKKIKSQKKD